MRLTETHFNKALKVDRDAGVIRGVKVLGKKSLHRRTYSDKSMDQAVVLYEGKGVNIDHRDKDNPNADRSVAEGFGRLKDVRREKTGIFADLHFLKSHPLAEQVCETAERMPEQFGLSHDADGSMNHKRNLVEELQKVYSVDLVRNPATNTSLFESENMMTTTLRAISRIQKNKVLARLLENEDLLSNPMGAAVVEPEMAVEVAPEAAVEEQVAAAFGAMIQAILADDSMDKTAKLKKIRDILDAEEKLLKPVETTPAVETPAVTPAADNPVHVDPEEKKTIESLNTQVGNLTESIDKLTADNLIRKVLESHGINQSDLDPENIKLLEGMTTAVGMNRLIESWPAYIKKPRTMFGSGRLTESETRTTLPANGKDMATALR